jgi:hypothetical protein
MPAWLRKFRARWEWARDVWRVLIPMRFPMFVLLVGAVLFLGVDQARDAVRAMIEDVATISQASWSEACGRYAVFLFAAFSWAFGSFYAARLISRLPPSPYLQYLQAVIPTWGVAGSAPDPLHNGRPLISLKTCESLELWCPRIVGGGVLAVIGATFLWVSWNDIAMLLAAAIGFAITLAAYVLLVRHRRWLMQQAGIAIAASNTRDVQLSLPTPNLARLAAASIILILLVFGASGLTRWPPEAAREWIALGMVALAAVVGVCILFEVIRPLNTAVFCALVIVMISLLLAFGIVPNGAFVRQYVGAPGGAAFAAAAWALGGTLILAVPAQITGLPIARMGLLLAVAWSFLPLDNHELRTTKSESIAQRTLPSAGKCLHLYQEDPLNTIVQAAQQWCEAASKRRPAGPLPMVIVATAGGASRAAFWTAKVLAELDSRNPMFHEDVFAISSVSGGSLGAAAWRLALGMKPPSQKPDTRPLDPQSCPSEGFQPDKSRPGDCLLAMLQQDYLGSLMFSFLFPDLVQRILPGGLLPDRAAALEHAWEDAWRSTFNTDVFSEPFTQQVGAATNGAGKMADWRPILLLNGTTEVDGRRIITSTLKIGPQFRGAIDFFDGMGQSTDLPVSTAVHNSARFTWLDAAGTLHRNGGHAVVDRILDGGYFENFGAATALDVLDTLIEAGAVEGSGCDQRTEDGTLKPEERLRCIRPIIVQITSDPDLPPSLEPNEVPTLPQEQAPPYVRLLPDVFAPILTFYDTRNGLGERSNLVLASRVREIIVRDAHPTGNCPAGLETQGSAQASCVIFRLTDKNIPMSWLLSRAAVARYAAQLPLETNLPVTPSVDDCKNLNLQNENALNFCLVAAWTRPPA